MGRNDGAPDGGGPAHGVGCDCEDCLFIPDESEARRVEAEEIKALSRCENERRRTAPPSVTDH